MATKGTSQGVALEDTIRDVYDNTQEAGSTRAEMQQALDNIADLCVEAVPDLDEDAGEGDETDIEQDDE
jgi:hypothetical protein